MPADAELVAELRRACNGSLGALHPQYAACLLRRCLAALEQAELAPYRAALHATALLLAREP